MSAWGRLGPPERAFAWLLALVATLSVLFWPTSTSLVFAWSNSETYSHGFFIVPAFLWLVWRRRHSLARARVGPTWWALPVLAALGLMWLLGQWMVLALPSQIALVAMVPATIGAVFGMTWVRALLFPLVFLFFAVPFGDSLVPMLMDWTADFTVAALRLSGVPVYRDGLHFEIPSGKWSVVDSCSGIRYLFACLAVSSLYAWTIYTGRARRLTFIGFALVIAIVANWVRAYAIVMLGHLSNNEIATGADHLVYGGLFFGIVVALVFTLGALWPERVPAAPKPERDADGPAPPSTQAPRSGEPPWAAAVAATVATVLVWPGLSISASRAPEQLPLAAPDIQPRGGWVSLEQPMTSWRPVLRNPASESTRAFAKGERVVGVHIGLFGRSTPHSKLTSSLNRLLQPDGLDPHWRLVKQGVAHSQWRADAVEVKTGVLVGGSSERLLAWQWYWVDGAMTADPLRATALQTLTRLRGAREFSGWVTVVTRDSGDEEDSARTLATFLSDMSESIGEALETTTLGKAGPTSRH